MRLRALPYYGGKNWIAPWIAARLPHTWRQTYVEPFAGMLAVLRCRQPCITEIANDVDGHVVNWWMQLRDNTEELIHKTWNTPHSRKIFDDSKALLLNGDKAASASDLDRAVAFQCVLLQSMTASVYDGSWFIRYSSSPDVGKRPHKTPDMMRALADRIRHVQFECRPAEEILDRAKDEERAVVYCDPPYVSTDTAHYLNDGKYDQDRVAKLLRAQKGFAALSGYVADGWDDLLSGWRRFDKDVPYRGIGEFMDKQANRKQRRVESLWVNKPVTGTRGLFQ